MTQESCDAAPSCPLENRRRLNDTEIEAIKEQLLESIYADIGKSIAKKVLWVFCALALAALAFLTGSGHITLGK